MDIWLQFTIAIVGPIISGLFLATMIGVYRMLTEFRRWTGRMDEFERTVKDELRENRQTHIAIRKEMNDHIAAELAILREVHLKVMSS